MKEKILKLRGEGKSYSEIQKILGCSKGTISYHCGKGQKDKTLERQKIRRKNPIIRKVEVFKSREKRYVVENIRKFQKKTCDENGKRIVDKSIDKTFNYKDVLEYYGENTRCYLSGVDINLFKNNYQFDHIIPISRGGDNSFDNLGITHKTVNQMKHNLTPDELIKWCKLILENNGYKIFPK